MEVASLSRHGRRALGFFLVALGGVLLFAVQPGLRAQQQPVLQVSPANLSFAGEPNGPPPGPQALTLANAGQGLMEWNAATDADWIVLGAGEGTLSGGRKVQLAVLVSTTGLSAGTYEGTITIAAPGAQGSPAQIPVTLNLTGSSSTPAVLKVNPTQLQFSGQIGGNDTVSQPLIVRNTGGQPMSWEARETPEWLSLDPVKGELQPGTMQSVTVSVHTSGFSAGTARASTTITIAAPGAQGSPAQIPVTLNLSAPSTNTSASLPSPGPVLFQDDFSNPNSGWCTGEDNDHAWGYKSGEYSITVKKTNWLFWCWAPRQTFSLNFIVEVDARQVLGPSGEYSILWGQDSDNYYAFKVSTAGSFRLDKQVRGFWQTPLVFQTTSSVIRRGTGTNHLEVVVRDNVVMLVVNGVVLKTVTAPSFGVGKIGIGAGTLGAGDIQVHFDNLKVFSAPSNNDRDGDGVPDDKDFCPDFYGKPETNGC